MPATNFTPIQLYRSTTASQVPTSGNLSDGELAINTNDEKLYFKNSGGTVKLLASSAGASGDVVGPASATDNAVVRFDGTTGKLVQNSVVTIADSTGDVAGVGALTMGGNLTLSGGTANGVAYLNGSKVLTTGSALTFDGTNFATTGTSTGSRLIASSTSVSVVHVDTSASAYGKVGNSTSMGWEAGIQHIFNIGAAEQARLTTSGLVAQQGAVFNESGADSDFRVESDTNANMFFLDAGLNHVNIGTSSNLGGVFNIAGTNTAIAFSYGDTVANNPLHTAFYGNFTGLGMDSSTAGIRAAGDPNANPLLDVGYYTGGTVSHANWVRRFSVNQNSVVVNDDSADVDFRVESDTNTHALFVDAGNNVIGINNSTPTALLELGMAGTANIANNVQTKITDFAAGNRFGTTGLTNNNDGIFFGMGVGNGIPAGFGFLREAFGWNTQIRFYTNNITSGPDSTAAMQEKMRIESSAIVINETGADQDFRVESDANTHMLFVDAGNNGVNIGNNSAVPPVSGLRVAGATNPAGGIVSTNLIMGYVASNYSGTRYWVLHVMQIGSTKQATAFNCMGDVHASSYTTWNLSNLYIRREYDSYNVYAGITGVIKSSVTVSVVDISYNSNRYVAIKFDGGDPGIKANLVGYLMDQQYTNNGTDAFFINGTTGVTENAVIATY